MAKKILSFFVILFLLQINFSVVANSLYKAVVKDSATQQSLQGVIVLIDGKPIGSTNNNGDFTYEISHYVTTDFVMEFNYFGYKKSFKKIPVSSFSNLDIVMMDTIYLLPISHELNAVTISGSKFEKRLNEETVSIEVVKPKQIQDAGITQMDDMLKRIPGVDVVDGQPNIRGGSGWSYGAGSRVLVMVDDMPMLTADAGDVKWDFLPIENCEQVEVLKGASSALYGSSALNGVINFRTAFPRNTPQTNIVIQQGIYDSPKNIYEKWTGNNVQKFHGANFFHSQKIKQLDLVIGGNYYTDDSYLQGNYNTRGRVNANLRYHFKHIDGLSIGLNVNAQKAQGSNFFVWGVDKVVNGIWHKDSIAYLTPRGGIDTPSTSLSFSKTYRYTIDPYISYNDKSGLKINFRNRFFNMNNENNTNQNSNAKLYYSELQVQKMFAHQLNITMGAVVNYSDVQSQLFGNHTANNVAYYLQGEKKIGNRLWLAAGGRYEFYRVDTVKAITKPLGRIGLNYQLAKATFLRASYGMGYRFPTIAEKYVNTYVSGVNVFPNTLLKPETGWNAEVGVKQNFMMGKMIGMLDIAGFYTRYNNMMEFTFDNFPTPKLPFNPGFQSRNIANTLIKGIDIAVFAQRKINRVEVSLHSGFTYILPQDLAFDTMNRIKRRLQYSDTLNNVLKYRYTTSWKTDAEVKWKKFTFGSYVRYNTYVVNIDQAFTFLFPSINDYIKKWGHKDIWIIDVRLQYQLNKNASLAFIVKNMLNFEYTERPGEIAPVRSFTMQFVYKL